jgi:hypothetical protein
MNAKQTVAVLLTALTLAGCGGQTATQTPAEKFVSEVTALTTEYGTKHLENAEMIDLGQQTCKLVRQHGYEEGKAALSEDPFVAKFYESAVRNLCPELMSEKPKY